MPKSLTFLGNESDLKFKGEFPTFAATINVLNSQVLQEILKIPGVELMDVHKIEPPRPPVAKSSVVGKVRIKVKPKNSKFHHPSGKPAHYFLTQFLAKNGQSGLAELKRHLKTLGFEPGTVMGAMTKMVERGDALSKKPHGYVLTEAGLEKAEKEPTKTGM